MAQSEIELELKNLFPAHTYADWKAAAEDLLKGKPFEKVLVTPTFEGFDLQPIYRKDDIRELTHARSMPGFTQFARCANAAGYTVRRWKVSQELPQSLPEELNRAALLDLKGEADELNILLDPATRKGLDPDSAGATEVGACGVSLTTLKDLEKALDGVVLDAVSLFSQSGAGSQAIYAMLTAYCAKKGIQLSKVQGNIGGDPIGDWMRNGSLPVSLAKAFDELAATTRTAQAKTPSMGTVFVDANIFHNAGSSAAQEAAYLLAEAVEYVRQLNQRGIPVEVIARSMRFGVGVGSSYFLEIAKLRAIRMLWARVLEAYGCAIEDLPIHIHARTSIANKTVLDPYVNMLRVTTEAFSAVLGGCDSMHVGPFDEVVRLPDDFSRRIARNVHFILSEECDLTKVIDPAGGSYAVEKLTDQIAAESWKLFQAIEAKGGLIAALKEGFIQKEIAGIASKRKSAYARRKDVIVGTNQYPNATEKTLDPRTPDYAAIQRKRAEAVAGHRESAEVEASGALMEVLSSILNGKDADKLESASKAFAMGATLGEVTKAMRGDTQAAESIEALPVRRFAEPFEKLRQAAQAHAEKTGTLPRILQVNWGPSRGYRLRADWTSGFYQVGGFEVLNDKDFGSIEDIQGALQSSGAKIAVITSSDEAYVTQVEVIAKAIKAHAPDIHVVVAGAPGETEAAWRAAGVDDFVNVRVNAYDALAGLQSKLGVS